ncbi:uncharacterized protein LOC142803381 [Rhipicephalus microplus]|uniref:uncharacterized protein LOC142803381 n=1 Tax=Rhipicephalus microplus TaxID=6941 RepID=UPI003F6BB122
MQREKKTPSAKNPAGNGASRIEDSAISRDQRNRGPSGDGIAGDPKPSSCHQRAPHSDAVKVRKRLGQSMAQLRRSMQQVADETVRLCNFKNDMFTLQDETSQLKMALIMEKRKAESLWNETEATKRPPGMSPPRPVLRLSRYYAGPSEHEAPPAPPAALHFYMDGDINAEGERDASAFHPLIVPWDMNDNDMPDFEGFQESLEQYITCGGSSPVENCMDGCSAPSSLLSSGGPEEAVAIDPWMHTQHFQWEDEHHRRQQTEHHRIRQREQEEQLTEREVPREQREQFLIEQLRSLLGCPRTRRQEQTASACASATDEKHDADQEQKVVRHNGGQLDDVKDSNRRRSSNAANLQYEELPLD